jgi:hypothetical protein
MQALYFVQSVVGGNMTYYPTVLEMKKLLANLSRCLDKARIFAAERKYDPELLLQSRLAPDMFPLWQQVQAVCDQAKYAAGRTTGKEMPTFPDGAPTLEELQKRLVVVAQYLDTFAPSDFAELSTRLVKRPSEVLLIE